MKILLRFIHKSFLLFLVVLVGCPTTEEINKTDPDTLLNQGIKHLDKCQYDKAISDFTKAIEIIPSAEAYYKRGNAYELKARFDFYKGIRVIGPVSDEAYYRKTNAYLDKAISDSNKAIEVNPMSAEAYYRRGNAYEYKAFSEFFKGFRRKKIDPKSAEALAYTDKAISDFNKAIELNPEYPEAYASRGPLYSLKGQSDKAKADRNKAMERFYWRAISYELKGQYEKACIDHRIACRWLGSKAACGEFDMLEEKDFCWVEKGFCGEEKDFFQLWLLEIVINRIGH